MDVGTADVVDVEDGTTIDVKEVVIAVDKAADDVVAAMVVVGVGV